MYGRDKFRFEKLEVAEGRIKSAQEAVEVLSEAKTTSDSNSRMVKRLALHMLHDYLELDTLDPLRFVDSRDDIGEIAKLLRENLEHLVCVIVEEESERRSKQLARRLLTALAAIDPMCREQIRELQKKHQTQPALVLMLSDDQTEAAEERENGQAQEDIREDYQYSDEGDSGVKTAIDNGVADDERKSE